jgi:putative alpha-1,2-mannosidase
MGFYPMNPADGKYIIGSPVLDRASIALPSGKKFTVIAENNSQDNVVVEKVFLNGQPLDRNYITYSEIVDGGELKFIMK